MISRSQSVIDRQEHYNVMLVLQIDHLDPARLTQQLQVFFKEGNRARIVPPDPSAMPCVSPVPKVKQLSRVDIARKMGAPHQRCWGDPNKVAILFSLSFFFLVLSNKRLIVIHFRTSTCCHRDLHRLLFQFKMNLKSWLEGPLLQVSVRVAFGDPRKPVCHAIPINNME